MRTKWLVAECCLAAYVALLSLFLCDSSMFYDDHSEQFGVGSCVLAACYLLHLHMFCCRTLKAHHLA